MNYIIRKYDSGPQIEGTLFVVENTSKYDDAYNFIRDNLNYKCFTLYTIDKFKEKKEYWKPYSQWWTSLWSIITVNDDGTYAENYTNY